MQAIGSDVERILEATGGGDGVRDSFRVSAKLRESPSSDAGPLPSLSLIASSAGAHRGNPTAVRVGEGSGVRHPRLKLGTARSTSMKATDTAIAEGAK